MKILTKSIFTLSIIIIGMGASASKSFAGRSCVDAVTTEASLAGDDDTGADPDLMTEECIAQGSSVKSIGQNKYSVLVDCGDMPEMMYNVTVSQNGDVCSPVDATQDKSYNPSN